MSDNKINLLNKLNAQFVTGVCCHWLDIASYDSDEHIETFVNRGKFSGNIANEQQPPDRYQQGIKNIA